MDLASHSMFVSHADPESGIVSYLLDRRVAPHQQGFYFVNDSMSADGRYLWFYCLFPPASGRSLGVADLEQGTIRHFPETQFSGVSPYVDPGTGEVFWCSGPAIYRRGPRADGDVEAVNCIPAEVIGGRRAGGATHLTRSADGKEFFIDANIGLEYYLGSLPLDGGDYELWERFNFCHNHAQFSPTDPDLVLFAKQHFTDQHTGERIISTDRVWFMRRGEAPRPACPEPTILTHEWWDASGTAAWAVKWDEGLWRMDVKTREIEKVDWLGGNWHSHSDRSGMLLVGDANERFYRGCPNTVNFLNRHTGQSIRIAAHEETGGNLGANYHIDPHPRFCANDKFVVYTTTVRGQLDVALVPVEALLARTGGRG